MAKVAYKYELYTTKRSRPKSCQLRSPNQNVACVSCDTCFMGYLGRRIRWLRWFLNFARWKVNVRSNQIKKAQITKHTYLVQFFLRIKKYNSCWCKTIINAKIAFQESGVISFTCSLDVDQQKKDIALELWVRFVCLYLDITYSCFWITWKFRILHAFLGKIEWCGLKTETLKNQA